MINNISLELIRTNTITIHLNQIMEKINDIMSQNSSLIDRYFLSLKIKLRKLNTHNVMMSIFIKIHYMTIEDYVNCEKMVNWLKIHEELGKIKLSQMNDALKSVYSYYVTDIGVYEDFGKSNSDGASIYYIKAQEIMQNVNGYPRTKSTIYFQSALTQLSVGDIKMLK